MPDPLLDILGQAVEVRGFRRAPDTLPGRTLWTHDDWPNYWRRQDGTLSDRSEPLLTVLTVILLAESGQQGLYHQPTKGDI